jgi:branched-chain amino acid transport system substrate-binding protein
MRIMTGLTCAVGLALLASTTARCANGSDSESIVLGVIYNLEGYQAVLDVPSSNGSQLAAAQLNERGGVLDRTLSLISLDGKSDVADLQEATREFLGEFSHLVALLGLSDTDMVLAAAKSVAADRKVFLTSGATSPKLPAQVSEWLFLACFGDNVQAAAGAEWAVDQLGARRALVLYDPSKSYPDLLQGYFIQRFEGLGGEILASYAIQPNAQDFDLPDIGEPDLVFLSVETAEDAARVIPILRNAGYAGPVLGGDGYDAEPVWSELPSIDDVYFTTHVYLGAENPNPKVGAFLDAYNKAYPNQKPNAFAALGYDAVALLAAAIEAAGDATPEAVREGLSSIESYEGVSGTISFAAGSRIPTKSVTILTVVNGRQKFVTEVVPEIVPPP